MEKNSVADYIDSISLQELQDAFSKMARMFSVISDMNGNCLTTPTHLNEFCNKMYLSEKGRKICMDCSRRCAEKIQQNGEAELFTCPAGIYEFAIPILLNGNPKGVFVGGQVLDEPPDEEKIRQVAREAEIDEEELLEASKQISVIPKSAIDRNWEFAQSFTKAIASMLFRSYIAEKLSDEAQQGVKAKSDFLANMSHEIRTPMNAVLGMANLAMKEKLPSKAKGYISQIISSGKLLLAIINDILDYSKIESGKMELIEEKYDPMSFANDITNIISSRLTDKPVDLIIDANPELPSGIMGDSIRIKQIVVNLANNAAKFTSQGKVAIHIDFKKLSEDIIDLSFDIEDTGIGIKEEDVAKLFKSFQQVDAKRNRNIEGTGLGLAISKNLVELMGGNISVSSVYGKGSTFGFTIPQRVEDFKPCIEKSESRVCGVITGSLHLLEQFEKDITRLGHKFVNLDSIMSPEEITEKGIQWLFVEQAFFSETIHSFIAKHQEITAVVITSVGAEADYFHPNIKVVQKPVYSMMIASVMAGIDVLPSAQESRNEETSFTAPEAKILIVDDNEVNLTVAKGLLEPVQMEIDTAMSGRECLTKISAERYDIIFMDHMMPVMDGVETTQRIRSEYPEYSDVPVIALTANVVQETRSVFFQAGMNDFVAKPIEVKLMMKKLRQWLPKEKIVSSSGFEKARTLNVPVIEGLDTEYAMGLLGNEELYMKVLADYWKNLEKKISLIRSYKKTDRIKLYTVEVHALKSSSRQIGALELAKIAEALEQAGNAGDMEKIEKDTENMLSLAENYQRILTPYCKKEEAEKKKGRKATNQDLVKFFNEVQESLDNLDLSEAEESVKNLESLELSPDHEPLFQTIKLSVEDMDCETAQQNLDIWRSLVKTGLLARAEELQHS